MPRSDAAEASAVGQESGPVKPPARGSDSAPMQAASVILARGLADREIFVVRRSASLKFFGGYHAFPGGKVSPADAAIPIHGVHDADARGVAAIRELFEETGVLLARNAIGKHPVDNLAESRSRLLAGDLDFGQFLRSHCLHLDSADLVPVCSLVTPAFSPIRFDTQFYLSTLPEGQDAEIWPGELDAGFWTTPEELLASWTRGECLVTPPTVSIMDVLRGRTATELPEAVQPLLRWRETGDIPTIFFAPGVQMIPLRTVGLPPTAYTNAYLVGNERLYLFDPGAHEPDEQQRLFDLLDSRLQVSAEASPSLAAVVLTHHHPDHIGAASAVAIRYGVPILAHPRTAELLAGRVRVHSLLHEGDRIELGAAPDGFPGWHLQALHTPGHASGHLVFYEPHYRLLFAGDLVSMLSSVVIAPPDGDLTAYLASLRRVREYDCRMLFPGHGGPSVRPRQTIDDCLAHRARREQELSAALAVSPGQTSADLALRLYVDLAEPLRFLAQWQVDAGLEKLRRDGRATMTDGRWSALPS